MVCISQLQLLRYPWRIFRNEAVPGACLQTSTRTKRCDWGAVQGCIIYHLCKLRRIHSKHTLRFGVQLRALSRLSAKQSMRVNGCRSGRPWDPSLARETSNRLQQREKCGDAMRVIYCFPHYRECTKVIHIYIYIYGVKYTFKLVVVDKKCVFGMEATSRSPYFAPETHVRCLGVSWAGENSCMTGKQLRKTFFFATKSRLGGGRGGVLM